ncbi:hypothetical protein GFB56_32825 [Ensifer sp. T173]|uniref:Uncharacterized protein n=1 Tax=Ensifer canadensis TaxID=555315 RepID=A0AAW4FW30_9HYPH|nr:hypothetical protein [Ensifer canadensis]MBM3095508.1 hypothetical protein [Ensifer canadensis]UBI79105.1 hypothetical protein J3R84_23690 [Ensifer canadensis]
MFETEAVDFPEENLGHLATDLVRLTRDKLESAEVTVIVASGPKGADLLERTIAETTRGPILALYDSAQYAVARDMDSFRLPSSSLAAWKADAAMLLLLYRKHRRRIVFVSLAAAQAEPEQFWSKVISHFKIADDTVPVAALPSCTQARKAWHTVLAHQAVSADAEAQALDFELEAAALPLELKSFDSDSAFAEISEMITGREGAESERQNQLARFEASLPTEATEIAAVKQRLVLLGAERDLLLQQLSDMEDAFLDQLPAAGADSDILVKNGVEGIDQAASILPDTAARQRHTRGERALLLDQLSEMEAVLVDQQRTISEQRDSIAKVRDEAKAAGRLVTLLQARLVDEEMQRASAKTKPSMDQSAALGFLDVPAHIGETIHALLNNSAWNKLPAMLRRRWQMRVLKASGLVDPAWYLEHHKDVAEANVDPLKHYMEHGAKEGRASNPSFAEKHARMLTETGLFDPVWYLRYYKDVAEVKMDPVRHYIEHGAKEGRAPNAGYL